MQQLKIILAANKITNSKKDRNVDMNTSFNSVMSVHLNNFAETELFT